jgi:RNA recognition motif-containing protein
MTKLFVVGIPRAMDAGGLKGLFDEFGDVENVTLITDRATGQSKGYGFVDLSDEVSARLAIKELDGAHLDGRTISVRVADKQPRPRNHLEVPVHQRQYEKVRQPRPAKRPRRSL